MVGGFSLSLTNWIDILLTCGHHQEDQPEEGAADCLQPQLHWECADLLHLCVVLELHHGIQEGATKGYHHKIIGYPLPSLEDPYITRCLRRARSILKDRTHPGHQVFELLAGDYHDAICTSLGWVLFYTLTGPWCPSACKACTVGPLSWYSQ